MPWPVGNSGWLARDVEGRLVQPKSLWPADAWSPVPKIPAAMFTRGDRDDPEPPGDDSDTSSACTSDEGPDAADEETPTTEPVELLEKFDDVAQGAEGPKVTDGVGAEAENTEVEPTPDDPAAAASDSRPAEEHVVHVVVDDSDDGGDPVSDLGADAATPTATDDTPARRKRQRDGDDLPDSAKRACRREHEGGGEPPVREPESDTAHTLGMWSQRLGEVHSTSCGDLCRCTALAQMKCPECGALVTDHWLQASKKVAETIWVKEQTVRDLLRDYMMTTMCRWNEEAGPVSRHLGAVLHELATNVEAATDISPPDISTSSSRRHRSKLVVPVEVAEKGLGDTGAIDIPDSVWDAMAPANFLWASEGTPPQPFSSDPPLVALVHTLLGQQLVAVSLSQKPPNARAYVQHKNEHKCSLILPMLDLNARCVDPLPFKLPTLDGLAHLLQLCALRREQLFYCTLDISNHFWSCRLPPPQRDSIRVGVRGRVYALQSLPFGWKHSPSMAQAILAAYLVEYFPGSVVVIQYADDVLVAGRHSSSVRQQALRTKADLEKAGWVVSPKSSLDPSDRVKWMGKVVGGDQGGVQNAPALQAHLVCCWLRLATTGYSDKALRRMLGKLQWALRPWRGAQPFLAGAYRWLNQGPSTAKCTPPKVLRGLLEGIACALVPWVPHGALGSTDTFYCDAARQGQHYYVGIWGDSLGMRIKRPPDWVATQQAAELAGIVETVRTGAYRRVQFLRIYGDNMSSLFSAMKGRAATACDAQNRLLRRASCSTLCAGLGRWLNCCGSRES